METKILKKQTVPALQAYHHLVSSVGRHWSAEWEVAGSKLAEPALRVFK